MSALSGEDGRWLLKRYGSVISGLALIVLVLGLANIAFFSVGYAYGDVSEHCSMYYTGDGWWCSVMYLLAGSFAVVHVQVRGAPWAAVSLSFCALSAIFSLIELVMSADALGCNPATKDTSYTMRWLMVVVEAFLLVGSAALVELQMFCGRINWSERISSINSNAETTTDPSEGGQTA